MEKKKQEQNFQTKQNDLEYIKEFSKIKIASICKELNIDKSNLWAGKTSPEATKTVKEEIKRRLSKLR